MTFRQIVESWESFTAWHAADQSLPCTQEQFEALSIEERELKVFSGEWL